MASLPEKSLSRPFTTAVVRAFTSQSSQSSRGKARLVLVQALSPVIQVARALRLSSFSGFPIHWTLPSSLFKQIPEGSLRPVHPGARPTRHWARRSRGLCPRVAGTRQAGLVPAETQVGTRGGQPCQGAWKEPARALRVGQGKRGKCRASVLWCGCSRCCTVQTAAGLPVACTLKSQFRAAYGSRCL